MAALDDTTRVSFSFADIHNATEAQLKERSFDLVHLPMYLALAVASRVRIKITSDYHDECDLRVFYSEDGQHRSRKYAFLIADINGCLTDSDAFYYMVHAAFEEAAEGLTYIGFERCGPPVFEPTSLLVELYGIYGQGIVLAGGLLPSMWREPMLSHIFELR